MLLKHSTQEYCFPVRDENSYKNSVNRVLFSGKRRNDESETIHIVNGTETGKI
jgi:6-phosphogluconolactonase/glucosamine-6-phosphate isomerase/deaminase